MACIIYLFICTSFAWAQDKETQLAIARIQYIYKAKQSLGDSAWATFGSTLSTIPLIYYNGNVTYIANPHDKLIRQFQPKQVFKDKGFRLFKLDYRIDNTPFYMMVSMSIGPDTASYDYLTPYIKCSSREEFEKVTRHPTNTVNWAAMVLHECFHGFQYLHKGFTKHSIESNFIYLAIGDSLQQLYRSYEWFKNAVDLENDLLLKAIQSTRKNETDSLVRSFFDVREKRRIQTKAVTNHDIGLLERSFETVEGTGRFVEAFAMEHPLPDKNLGVIDSSFYMRDKSPFVLPVYLYETEASGKYYYTTGYNMTRLLKKLKYDYTSVLFKLPQLTLEDLLKR
jgi:hypothetical protein